MKTKFLFFIMLLSLSQFSVAEESNYIENAMEINMSMIWVDGGEFLMGCTSEQSGCESDEIKVRRVKVDGFWIGMLEVTQSQWEKLMGTTIRQKWAEWMNSSYAGEPSRGLGPDYPMYCVSWFDAMDFCRELSKKTGKIYTLPTEAQWEFAARGGLKADGTKYAGSNIIDAVAWYQDNSNSETNPCGTRRPNGLGIYDMSGNVGEWCKDWYGEYQSNDTNNPTGPSVGTARVNRGGGWGIYASNCRVTHRDSDYPHSRHRVIGFRVVCIP